MWREYLIVPFLDMDDPDVPGWKIFMIEGNGGWQLINGTNQASWRVRANLTEAQHTVMIAHPSVTYAP